MHKYTYFLLAGGARIVVSALAGSILANAAATPLGLTLNYRYE
jgi:hypothetical protein